MKYEIRQAGSADVPDVVSAVTKLLSELRGVDEPEAIPGAERACLEIIEGGHPGAVFVAHLIEDESHLIGIVTATVDLAIVYGGKYVMIQELWVNPEWRSDSVGGRLLEALWEHFRNQGISIFKVCLPPSSFTNSEQTHDFYLNQGFFDIGTYMRKNLDD